MTDEVCNFSLFLMTYYYLITFGVIQTHEESRVFYFDKHVTWWQIWRKIMNK